MLMEELSNLPAALVGRQKRGALSYNPYSAVRYGGALVAGQTKGKLPSEISEEDKSLDFTRLIPGVGSYAAMKRIGSTLRDDKGKDIPGARASALAEGLMTDPTLLTTAGRVAIGLAMQGRSNLPLKYMAAMTLGKAIGGPAALVTRSRTRQEQADKDKSPIKNIIRSLLPGYADYERFKRMGSTVDTLEKAERAKKEM